MPLRRLSSWLSVDKAVGLSNVLHPVRQQTLAERRNSNEIVEERRMRTDWSDVALIVAVFFLIMLFVGEPNLLDAVVKRVGGCQ